MKIRSVLSAVMCAAILLSGLVFSVSAQDGSFTVKMINCNVAGLAFMD